MWSNTIKRAESSSPPGAVNNQPANPEAVSSPRFLGDIIGSDAENKDPHFLSNLPAYWRRRLTVRCPLSDLGQRRFRRQSSLRSESAPRSLSTETPSPVEFQHQRWRRSSHCFVEHLSPSFGRTFKCKSSFWKRGFQAELEEVLRCEVVHWYYN